MVSIKYRIAYDNLLKLRIVISYRTSSEVEENLPNFWTQNKSAHYFSTLRYVEAWWKIFLRGTRRVPTGTGGPAERGALPGSALRDHSRHLFFNARKLNARSTNKSDVIFDEILANNNDRQNIAKIRSSTSPLFFYAMNKGVRCC